MLPMIKMKLPEQTCVPVANPSTYTYYKWQHKSKYGVLIRELDGGQNGVLTLPNIPVEDIYQDNGECVCTGDCRQRWQSKTDRIWLCDNTRYAKQTGSDYVIINGM
jgi:hypothetical protein